ncbi:hypothetical protein JHW43_003650 [Diplocarpon mali]|nr:hypothetical protein JHW43_003650 [Diplocarpon mali]
MAVSPRRRDIVMTATTPKKSPTKPPIRPAPALKTVGQLTRSKGEMVKVYVGASRTCWDLHENVICSKSEFFEKGFRGGFAEGFSKTMHLEEDDPAVFELFVDWLYGPPPSFCTKAHDKKESWRHLLRWYGLEVFADKIGVEGLAGWGRSEYEECVSLITHYRPQAEEVVFVYEMCPETSMFRNHLVEKAMNAYLGWGFEDFEYWGEMMACNASFAEDVGRKLKRHMELKDGECFKPQCSAHKDKPEQKKFGLISGR